MYGVGAGGFPTPSANASAHLVHLVVREALPGQGLLGRVVAVEAALDVRVLDHRALQVEPKKAKSIITILLLLLLLLIIIIMIISILIIITKTTNNTTIMFDNRTTIDDTNHSKKNRPSQTKTTASAPRTMGEVQPSTSHVVYIYIYIYTHICIHICIHIYT